MQPVFLRYTMKRTYKPGLPRPVYRPKYRQRNFIDVDVKLAQTKLKNRYPLRQACQELYRDGNAGLQAAVLTTVLFI